jgi:hypothetical protein
MADVFIKKKRAVAGAGDSCVCLIWAIKSYGRPQQGERWADGCCTFGEIHHIQITKLYDTNNNNPNVQSPNLIPFFFACSE